ncbi:MAG: 50S ribosomal protein L30 [Candidatus Micrarchaeota archaeon]|nr:50S ribosomal protein L30 [Candidatus Micrarchaeota archaeon]
MQLYAVVRVRGKTGIKPDIRQAMGYLNLSRANHCVVMPATGPLRGTLQLCKDYVTWGELDSETLSSLIMKRGRLLGNKRITEEYLQSKGHKGFSALAAAVLEGKASLQEAGLKKVFRLNPPKGGYKIVKRPFPKGALGYRGDKINALLRRMI